MLSLRRLTYSSFQGAVRLGRESRPRAFRLFLKSPSGCPGMMAPDPDEDLPVHEQDTFLVNGNVGWRRGRFQTCLYNPTKQLRTLQNTLSVAAPGPPERYRAGRDRVRQARCGLR